MYKAMLFGALILCALSCSKPNPSTESKEETSPQAAAKSSLAPELAGMYTEFTLTADLSGLSDNQKKMIPILIEIAKIMDDIFWQQAYGDKDAFLNGITDPEVKKFATINYGPWNRLDEDKPFIPGVGPKPKGARFYPADVTKEEIENSSDESLRSLYTMVRRDENGKLYSVPYREAFKDEITKAADLIDQAAALAEDAGFKKYLTERAKALRTDEYYESDLAWMDMKTNPIDFVVGPIEVYEDKLFNNKAAHEAYVLIKDMAWSERLARFAKLLPDLQRGLPVDAEYKKEMPGTDSDLNAYDVIYYAGDCNAASKTIAINLPNDERVQELKGSRRLQLKNAMRAKFDKILVPLSEKLIAADQRKHITFDAFFSNTMFHEVAHGLGIKNTIDGKNTVRKALKELSSAMEEGKADVLGLYMITELLKKGEIEGAMEDYYVTFIASIFRSIRFGASSAHGRANMLRFNFFAEMGALARQDDGAYRIDFDKMGEAMTALSRKILTLQGDGDYEGVKALLEEKGAIKPELQSDLDGLTKAGIPVDIVFRQGVSELNL
ncbi:MAG: Zn-dependent hydrolase [Acidobacteriota bacterium]|nr:Zn-dependent hydrolase [Acidobacteriota bacterium]